MLSVYRNLPFLVDTSFFSSSTEFTCVCTFPEVDDDGVAFPISGQLSGSSIFGGDWLVVTVAVITALPGRTTNGSSIIALALDDAGESTLFWAVLLVPTPFGGMRVMGVDFSAMVDDGVGEGCE